VCVELDHALHDSYLKRGLELVNALTRTPWDQDLPVDLSAVFNSCIAWASTPGWAEIQRHISKAFGGFHGVSSVELGCGEGKVSLLFAILGATTTLVDYSAKQLDRARYIAQKFDVEPTIVHGNILELPESLCGQFDVAMSYGTAEHFFSESRQEVFDAHLSVLKEGGLAIIWVPNRSAFLFHLGRAARKILRRPICRVKEKSFGRRELANRARAAGFCEVHIFGADLLRNDFRLFIVNVDRFLPRFRRVNMFGNPKSARADLLLRMSENNMTQSFLGEYFSGPLVLIAKRGVERR